MTEDREPTWSDRPVPSLAEHLADALDRIAKLEAEVERLALLLIEARNPGIDMDDVRRIRAGGRAQ